MARSQRPQGMKWYLQPFWFQADQVNAVLPRRTNAENYRVLDLIGCDLSRIVEQLYRLLTCPTIENFSHQTPSSQSKPTCRLCDVFDLKFITDKQPLAVLEMSSAVRTLCKTHAISPEFLEQSRFRFMSLLQWRRRGRDK